MPREDDFHFRDTQSGGCNDRVVTSHMGMHDIALLHQRTEAERAHRHIRLKWAIAPSCKNNIMTALPKCSRELKNVRFAATERSSRINLQNAHYGLRSPISIRRG